MKRVGVIPVHQPSYLHDFGDDYFEDLKMAAHELQPWRDELNAGLRVVLSSDSDVTTYNPLVTVTHALMRTTLSGRVLGAHHRLTLDEALFAHTIDAAYAVGMEHRIGSLGPAKAADFIVLSQDIRAVAPDEIQHLTVQTTVINGDTMFAAQVRFPQL